MEHFKLKVIDKIENVFYGIYAHLSSVFGKQVRTKYIKLISFICTSEKSYRFIEFKKNTGVIITSNADEQDVFRWEIYRDFTDKKSWDYQHIKITCTPLIGSYKFPIVKIFEKSENQGIMFSSMMGEVTKRLMATNHCP